MENSNRYPYPAHSHISDPIFITEVLEENDIYFCFDIAHAIISYRNWYYAKYDSLMDFILAHTLDRCIEIHISSAGSYNEFTTLMFDKHLEPTDFEFNILSKVLKVVPKDVFVAIEYYKDFDKLLNCYERLKEIK